MGGRGRVPPRGVGVVVLVLGLLAVPERAAAVGCFKGTRPSTVPEKTFHVETLKVLKAAMPVPPAGWRVVEETEVRPPRIACIGQEREPLALDYRIRFRRAGAAADERGSADGSLEDAIAGDTEIVVEVNPRGTHLGGVPELLAVPGVTFALRRGSVTSSVVYLLLGDWSLESEDGPRSSDSRADAHLVADTPSTKVQALAVRVAGDAAGTDALARRINLGALNALVYR